MAMLVRGVLWTRCAPTIATEGAKGRVELTRPVDRPKVWTLALLSLKRSSMELAFLLNK